MDIGTNGKRMKYSTTRLMLVPLKAPSHQGQRQEVFHKLFLLSHDNATWLNIILIKAGFSQKQKHFLQKFL